LYVIYRLGDIVHEAGVFHSV